MLAEASFYGHAGAASTQVLLHLHYIASLDVEERRANCQSIVAALEELTGYLKLGAVVNLAVEGEEEEYTITTSFALKCQLILRNIGAHVVVLKVRSHAARLDSCMYSCRVFISVVLQVYGRPERMYEEVVFYHPRCEKNITLYLLLRTSRTGFK